MPRSDRQPDASMRIVILHGPDHFAWEEHGRALVEALRAAHGDIAEFTYDGTNADPAEILDELRSYGLLAPHKLVRVDQADKLLAAPKEDAEPESEPGPVGRRGAAARQFGARALFERYAEAPADGATLLLRAETWRPGRFDKLVEKVGAKFECKPLDERGAVGWSIERCATAHRASISREAAAMLVERIGSERHRLDSELAKLSAYVGAGKTISPDAVRELVGLSREEATWVIQETLLGGSPAAAVRKLRELLEVSRQPEQLVTWAISDLLRKVHAAAQLLREGAAPAEVARALKLWGPSARAVPAAAKQLGAARAAQLLDDAIRADQRTKRGIGEGPRTLEALAVQIADTMAAH